MKLAREWLTIPAGESTYRAYRARPEAADKALPAVVLVQEIWGVDEHIQDLAERLAAAGYVALAPDLYSPGGARQAALEPPRLAAVKAFLDTVPPALWWDEAARGAALAALPAAERRELTATSDALFAPRDQRALVSVLRDAARFLRGDAGCTGRVGSVGWCMGGALSARLACGDPELAAAVIFYGASPEADHLAALVCPVLGFYGGDDPRITGTVPTLAAAMEAAGKDFEWHVYPGAAHAFFNDTRRAYDVDAARDAWARVLGFLARTLSPVAQEGGRTPA